MRILFWNILHGGGPSRTPEIILTLLERGADVIALCEFRVARGSQIRAALADHGYLHQSISYRVGRSNGMLLASRQPYELVEATDLGCTDTNVVPLSSRLAPDFAGREIDVRIGELMLTALHIADDAAPTLKAAHWNRTISLARARRDQAHLIIGDLNTARGNDTHSSLACAQRLGVLTSLGFHDLWPLTSSGENPLVSDGSTWRDPLGAGRRIDAAWASSSLERARCEHIHPLAARISDHCALLVDLH